MPLTPFREEFLSVSEVDQISHPHNDQEHNAGHDVIYPAAQVITLAAQVIEKLLHTTKPAVRLWAVFLRIIAADGVVECHQ